MKKTILLAAMALATTVCFGQRKMTSLIDSSKVPVYSKQTKDTVAVGKAKVITIDSMSINIDNLKALLIDIKAGYIPLMVSPIWIDTLYGFIQTSKNGEFISKDIDALKSPLIPYLKYIRSQGKN